MNIPFPEQFQPLFDKSLRHIGFHGGRGGAKSWSFASAILEEGRQRKIRVLCVREIQKTIKESVHKLLKDTIERYGFSDYKVTDTSIINTITGTDFFFMGLYRNKDSIKSVEGVDICWVEEAQSVSRESLDYLIPTIRKDGSQLWYSFNRFSESDPVWEKIFRNPSKRTHISKVNMMDLHPIFQGKEPLEEMEVDKANDYQLYLHIWEGEPLGQSADAVIPRLDVMQGVSNNIEVTSKDIIMYGMDAARFGGDEITFWKVAGAKVIKSEFNKYLPTTKTESKWKEFVDTDIRCKQKIDLGNMGSGIYDHLEDDGYNVVGINFGGTKEVKEKSKYYDIATEMWFNYAKIAAQSDIPNDTMLIEELTTRQYFYKRVTIEGAEHEVKMIEPKKVFKKRLRRSPDRSDGLILAYYEPFEKQVEETHVMIEERQPISAGF